MYLLDVNVLMALGDPNHVHYFRAQEWFASSVCESWATCPLTENGFVRIMGGPGYPDFEGDNEEARVVLRLMTAKPGHQFWPDELSILRNDVVSRLSTSKQLTDIYLLALAVKRGGQLATLDKRVDPDLVRGGAAAYYVIPELPDARV